MDVQDSLNETLAHRDRREHRKLPKRYRDVLPGSLATFPPSLQPEVSALSDPIMLPSSISSQVRKVLKSMRNSFGLFRQYCATRFPEHDPDENLISGDLMDTSPDSLSSLPVDSCYPYSTQSSLNDLLKIVRHPDFRPADVARANWRHINAQLGGGSRDEDGWEDEPADGDWITAPIRIKVPFH